MPHQSHRGYVAEEFSDGERAALAPHFTNHNLPVFALTNLPEVVKGALFARWSRSPAGLRRIFLDEFAEDLHSQRGPVTRPLAGEARAEALYDRVFFDYGDDSVAQLGGAHLACEQASNILTKVLERGRLMAYLEQSTRYIAYDQRLGGRYRYYRPPEVLDSKLGARFVSDMDGLFTTYGQMFRSVERFLLDTVPQSPADCDATYRRSVRAQALDAVRGLLPAASLSNVGIYGTGQAFEALLLRMFASPLGEARSYAQMMLIELRKVIPSFLRRVDAPDRGGRTIRYLADNREAMEHTAAELLAEHTADPHFAGEVDLVDYDPDGETKAVAAMLYPHTRLPERTIERRVREMSATDRLEVIQTYCGDRTNRRHKPGRALERTHYRFDVRSDYGAFRDLQRHRMLTIEWQPLSPRHGYRLPDLVRAAGLEEPFHAAMDSSAQLYGAVARVAPASAPYAVSLGFRVRYVVQMNAREAMHMLELRTTPQGHPSYRRVCQSMHRLIAERAGHRALAAAMSFVNHDNDPTLARLSSERAAEHKRAEAPTGV